MACGEQHPEVANLRCQASTISSQHEFHYAYASFDAEEETQWRNDSYVPVARTKREARSALGALVERHALTGDQRRDIGMATAIEHASGDWKTRFNDALREMARSGREFTSEDITAIVGQPPEGSHPNAVGAMIGAASRAKVITEVGQTKADRPNQNSARLTVWRGVTASVDA